MSWGRGSGLISDELLVYENFVMQEQHDLSSTPTSDSPVTAVPPPTPVWNVQIDRAAVIAAELNLKPQQVERTLALLDEGATLPTSR